MGFEFQCVFMGLQNNLMDSHKFSICNSDNSCKELQQSKNGQKLQVSS